MSAGDVLRLLGVWIAGLVLLAGCVTTLAPTRALLNQGSANASEVAVAVQANGIKHYVWTECSGGDCQLVYRRGLLGTHSYQYVFTVAPGGQIKYPDIAVTAEGRAFVVRSACFNNICTDYYSVIPADATDSTFISSQPLASPGANSAGAPKVEARDTIVYATYLVEDSLYPRLRYRQLSGGASGGYVDTRPLVSPSQPSLAIGSNGTLYVTWKADNISSSEIAYGTNSGTSGDVGLIASYDALGNYSFRNPDIALDPSNTPYIVYAYDGGDSDIIRIQCAAPVSACFSGITTRTIPLDRAYNPWRLRGSPQIQVLGTVPNVVFSAANNLTDNNEIWYYSPPSSGIDPGPTRTTTNTVQDDEPLFVKERSNFGDVGVVAWRTYIAMPGVAVDCQRDAYTFYFNSSTIRRVFESTGGCQNASRDLDANGPWVAGMWIDRQTNAEDSRVIPWTVFNAHTIYSPIIAK